MGDLAPNPLTAPTPISKLASNWIIDWRRFYDFGNNPPGVTLNHARRIDPFVVKTLHTLPGGASLPFLNLEAGA